MRTANSLLALAAMNRSRTALLLIPLVCVAFAAGPIQAGTSEADVDTRPSPAEDEGANPLHIGIDRPQPGQVVGVGPPWVELRGWTGFGVVSGHDIVIVVDISGSTAAPSGIDVDEDGQVGHATRRFNRKSSDSGDSILSAELLGTRRLVRQLDVRRSRIGIVSFAGRPRIEAAISTPRDELARALDNLDGAFASGGTDLAGALQQAQAVLFDRSAGNLTDRHRTVLILSDGYPTVPSPKRRAERVALEAARLAAERGVRIHTFALGIGEPKDKQEDVFARIAGLAGGSLTRVARPGDVAYELPRIRLEGVETVEIENLTSGASGRAIRLFPDGSFDGFIRLVPGSNTLRVTAIAEEGSRAVLERRVHFELSADPVAAEARRRALLERLRERAAENAFARRAKGTPEASERELEIELEDDPDD